MVTGCVHPAFRADVRVTRVENAGSFVAEVAIECASCGEPFRFLGAPMGFNWSGPATSVDGLELRVPIEPGPIRFGMFEAPHGGTQ